MSQTLGKIESRGTLFSILLLIAFFIVYAVIFDSKIDMNGDNAYYYMLGKALSSGEGYVNLNSINKTANNHFPPGYPAIIAVVLLFVSNSIFTVKLVNGIFFLLSVLMTYSLTRIVTNRAVLAALVAIFIMFNAHLLRYSTIMMTEVPFLFFSLLSTLLFIRTDFTIPFYKNSRFFYVVITLAISYYIRSLGVAILGGMILYLLWERKWMFALGYLASVVALAIPWFLRGQALGGNSYLRQLLMVNPYRPELGQIDISGLFDRIFINFERYITKEIPGSIMSFLDITYAERAGFGEWLIGLLILALILFGIFKLPKFRLLIGGILLANFAILLIWPQVWVGVRFILPAVPIILLAFLHGLREFLVYLGHRFRIRRSISASFLMIGIIAFIPGVNELREKASKPYSPSWENYFSIADKIKLIDDPNLVVSCRKPVLFFLRSNTYTTNYKYTPDDQELLSDLENRQVDFVVIDQLGYSSTYRYLYPAVEKNRDRFEVIEVEENPDTYLLRFLNNQKGN